MITKKRKQASIVCVLLAFLLIFQPLQGQAQASIPPAAYSNDIEGFVTRMYEVALNRSYDNEGYNYWVTCLKTGKNTGADIIYFFLLGKEIEMKNLSDEQFIEVLYLTIFNRPADNQGKKYWLELLNNGVSRRGITSNFIDSKEFQMLCTDFNIVKGESSVNEYRDINPGITAFVSRFYTKALHRKADTEGLNYWTETLIKKEKTGADIASLFFTSEEFHLLAYDNSSYVKILYRVFFDREGDNEGTNYWMAQLNNGAQRNIILAEFINSREFSMYCQQYGIDPGSYRPDYSEAVVTTFVCNVYPRPDTRAALDTQALYNQKVQILGRSGSFLHVMVTDGYSGYIEEKNISYSLSSISGKQKLFVAKTSANITDAAGSIIARAPMGAELFSTGSDSNSYQVNLPSGQSGYIQKSDVRVYANNTIPFTSGQAISDTGHLFMGTKYLWGGTSADGLDCSGFTYICYRMNGITLPRDAEPQSKAGTKINRADIQVGDLVFFSSTTARNNVTHTGIYIGNNNFIHASSGKGRVDINSLDETYYKERLVSVNRYY